jgi:uncharacterized RDD family membrane protein YckC
MRTLEILTTQNVTIEYPLAGVQERFIAFILDVIFIFILSLVLYFSFVLVMPVSMTTKAPYFSIYPTFIFYSLLSELINGRSWGKSITGLKIVKVNGNEVKTADSIARWIFRVIDIYLSLGGIGIFLITSTIRSQRLGDIVANTAVIKIKPGENPKLSQIEKIRSLKDYSPVYRQVVQMNESQMVQIKSMLEEIKKYPNKSHQEALVELTNVVCERLGVVKGEKSDSQFLQQLINDYIVLTRSN